MLTLQRHRLITIAPGQNQISRHSNDGFGRIDRWIINSKTR
jgi:hypothetical protein